MNIWQFALLAVASPVAAQDRELSTDRPDKTESAYTVPSGRIQIELDLATHTRDGDRRTVSIAPVNLKAGVAPDTDIQLVIEPYVRETAAGRVTDGFGDITIRLKHNLWGNNGGKTAFALMPLSSCQPAAAASATPISRAASSRRWRSD